MERGNTVWMEHHLYVCDKNSEELRRHIAFRDYLREHTEVANKYGNLKEELARESKNRSSYIEGKTVFITNILKNKLRRMEYMPIVEIESRHYKTNINWPC